LIRQIGALAGAWLLLSIFMPGSAAAQCSQWNITGKWYIEQGSFVITVELEQRGKVITGIALHDASNGGVFRSHAEVQGRVDGTIEGDNLEFEIFWPEGLTGVYQGKFRPSGRVEGATYDKSKPSSRANWNSSTLLPCSDTSPGARTATTSPPVYTSRELSGQIRVNKAMGRVPANRGSSQPAASPCDIFYVAVLDPTDQFKTIAYTSGPLEQGPDVGEFYVCNYKLQVPTGKKLYAVAGMGGVRLLPKQSRDPLYITDAWIGGTRPKPPAGYERGFVGRYLEPLRVKNVYLKFELLYAQVDP